MDIRNYIKMLYSNMGYLPGCPYHLISDKEMFDAFLRDDGFFANEYPCPSEELEEAYEALKECIEGKIKSFLEDDEELPKWIYSYMIMEPITFNSDEQDIAYISDMGNIESAGLLAEFTPAVAHMCYSVSTKWLKKQPSKYADRVPTMFGEAHVVKSLRLDQANILLD